LTSSPDNGLINLSTPYSVAETLQRLEALISAKGLTIFARIDHSGEAAKVGLSMPPTELLIFGSPKSGTPLMIASPTLALDLPLKALVWQDAAGATWLTYNSSEYLQQRHGIPANLVQNIAGVRSLFEEAVRQSQ
jgi:uncharacterized protein (DUF302 family)